MPLTGPGRSSPDCFAEDAGGAIDSQLPPAPPLKSVVVTDPEATVLGGEDRPNWASQPLIGGERRHGGLAKSVKTIRRAYPNRALPILEKSGDEIA